MTGTGRKIFRFAQNDNGGDRMTMGAQNNRVEAQNWLRMTEARAMAEAVETLLPALSG